VLSGLPRGQGALLKQELATGMQEQLVETAYPGGYAHSNIKSVPKSK
jgi:hypothetical protein